MKNVAAAAKVFVIALCGVLVGTAVAFVLSIVGVNTGNELMTGIGSYASMGCILSTERSDL